MNLIKKEILKLIEENKDKETFCGKTEDISVSWYRVRCLINKDGDRDEFRYDHDCVDSEIDKEMPYEDVVDLMSKKHNLPKDEIEFMYEGFIKYKNTTIEYFGYDDFFGYYDIIGYKSIIEEIKEYIEKSRKIETELSKAIFETQLKTESVIEEKWRKKDKEYKDERYVAIVRTEGNEDWYFNELFDYLEENNQEDIYKIYQLRRKTKCMYITKSKLNELKESNIPYKIKEDIENVVSREENCELCGNTTYVNTHPYVYDGEQCVGRLYACPICLDLHDLRMSPDFNYIEQLNGEEKMDMYDLIYNKVMKRHQQG